MIHQYITISLETWNWVGHLNFRLRQSLSPLLSNLSNIYFSFLTEDSQCELCENVSEIKYDVFSERSIELIESSQPAVLKNVPGYFDSSVDFNNFKMMFQDHHKELDEAICEISLTADFTLMSEFFKLTEEEVMERNISIKW